MLEKSLFARHGQLPGSLEMAYLGDTLYDLYVRSRLVAGGGRMKALHGQAVHSVCAHGQAEALSRIEARLTEAESAVVRRARNCKQSPARHADPAEYHRATGLEALLGYLYLTSQIDRLDELMRCILDEESKETR